MQTYSAGTTKYAQQHMLTRRNWILVLFIQGIQLHTLTQTKQKIWGSFLYLKKNTPLITTLNQVMIPIKLFLRKNVRSPLYEQKLCIGRTRHLNSLHKRATWVLYIYIYAFNPQVSMDISQHPLSIPLSTQTRVTSDPGPIHYSHYAINTN